MSVPLEMGLLRLKKSSPLFCLAPIVSVLIAIGFSVLTVLAIHPDWAQTWHREWMPRAFGLNFVVVFWCLGVVIRGNRLYCGGTKISEETDRHKYLYLLPFLIACLVATWYAYRTANFFLFFVTTVLTIVVVFSEVAWGDPIKILKVS